MSCRTRSSQVGASLIEVLIAFSGIALILAATYGVVIASQKTTLVTRSATTLELNSSRVMDLAVGRLYQARAETAVVSPLGDSVTFQRAERLVDGAIQWGQTSRIAVVADPEDPPNGTDDDSDGVVDEMRVVYTVDVGGPGERSVVWADGVAPLFDGEQLNGIDDNGNGLADEPGFHFQMNGVNLVIRLAMQRSISRDVVGARTLETSITLRN